MNLSIKTQMNCLLFPAMLLALFLVVPVGNAQAGENKWNAEKVKKEGTEFLKSISGYTAQQRDEALKKSKEYLERLDKRIEALEDQIEDSAYKVESKTKKESREALKKLRKLRTKVAVRYGNLESSSTEAWEEISEGFSGAIGELNSAFENAVEKFSK